jgi:hypothetical protein
MALGAVAVRRRHERYLKGRQQRVYFVYFVALKEPVVTGPAAGVKTLYCGFGVLTAEDIKSKA